MAALLYVDGVLIRTLYTPAQPRDESRYALRIDANAGQQVWDLLIVLIAFYIGLVRGSFADSESLSDLMKLLRS